MARPSDPSSSSAASRSPRGAARAARPFRVLLRRFGAGDDLAWHALINIGAGALSAVLALSFRLVVGSRLGPGEFGLVFSLVAIVDIALVMRGGIQLAIARVVARLDRSRDGPALRAIWTAALRRYAMVGAGAFVVAALFSPATARLLHFGPAVYAIIVASSAVPVLLVAVNTALLQGLQRFAAFAVITVAIPGARLLAALALLSLGAGIPGALVAYVAGSVVAALLGAFFLRDLWRGGADGRDARQDSSWRESAAPVLTTLGLAGLLSGDVVLARVLIEPDAAGVYAAVTTLGSMVLVATAGVALAMFPKAARRHGEGRRPGALLGMAALYVCLIGVATAVFVALTADFLLGTLFGAEYRPGTDYAVLYIGVMTVVWLVYLLAQYALAVQLEAVSAVTIGAAVLQVALILLWHGDGEQIALARLAAASVTIGAIALLLVARERGQRALPTTAP